MPPGREDGKNNVFLEIIPAHFFMLSLQKKKYEENCPLESQMKKECCDKKCHHRSVISLHYPAVLSLGESASHVWF